MKVAQVACLVLFVLLVGFGSAFAAAPQGTVALGDNSMCSMGSGACPAAPQMQCKPLTALYFVRTDGYTTNHGTCPSSGTRQCWAVDSDAQYYYGTCWGEPVQAAEPEPPASSPTPSEAQQAADLMTLWGLLVAACATVYCLKEFVYKLVANQ